MLSKINKALSTVAISSIAMLFIVLLAGCSNITDPNESDYVGVWACYKSKAGDAEARPDSIDQVTNFLVLEKNGNAEMAIMPFSSKPATIECKWVATHKDKSRHEEAGVILIGEDFENPYSFFYYPGESFLAEERLIDGNLKIDYGYRTEYLEKISNDPNYQPWMK